MLFWGIMWVNVCGGWRSLSEFVSLVAAFEWISMCDNNMWPSKIFFENESVFKFVRQLNKLNGKMPYIIVTNRYKSLFCDKTGSVNQQSDKTGPIHTHTHTHIFVTYNNVFRTKVTKLCILSNLGKYSILCVFI